MISSASHIMLTSMTWCIGEPMTVFNTMTLWDTYKTVNKSSQPYLQSATQVLEY